MKILIIATTVLTRLTSSISARCGVTADEARAIAKEAYIFNYPLVMMYRTIYLQSIDTTSKSYSGARTGITPAFTSLNQRN